MKINLQSAVTILVGQFFLCFHVALRDTVNGLPIEHSQEYNDNYPMLPPSVHKYLIQRIPELASLRSDFILTKLSPEGVQMITNRGDHVQQMEPYVIGKRNSRSPSEASNTKAGKNSNSSKNPWYQVQVHYEESGNTNYRTWKFHPAELMIPTIKAMQGSKKEEHNGISQSMTRRNYAKNPSKAKRGNYKYASGNEHRMNQRLTSYDFV